MKNVYFQLICLKWLQATEHFLFLYMHINLKTFKSYSHVVVSFLIKVSSLKKYKSVGISLKNSWNIGNDLFS